MKTIHEHAEDQGQSLGSRLHAMRESRGWTLEHLADQAGLSKAYLSRLESGDRNPSMAALQAIGKALGVSMAALLEQPDDSAESVLVRHNSILPLSVNGLHYTPLSSSTKPFNLHPIEVVVPPDRPGDESYQHEGEEWLYVMSGRLRLTIHDRQHVLAAGDCAHFDSRQPHRLDALDGREARVILVACPIPMTLNSSGQPAVRAAGQVVG